MAKVDMGPFQKIVCVCVCVCVCVYSMYEDVAY
jgi:hypothetical protein